MLNLFKILALFLCIILIHNHDVVSGSEFDDKNIPLPEHPRPDFMRTQWINLNGPWDFKFDNQNVGLQQAWSTGKVNFAEKIMVPFSWGSKLSGIEDEADIGWYAKLIEIPKEWVGRRVFLVIGACDWQTTAWLDGNILGKHQGGYTPFEFDLSPFIDPGTKQRLVLRVDDTPHEFKLEGKQGYGRAAGIWQTVYLEARPKVAIQNIFFTPDIDKKKVSVRVLLDQAAKTKMKFSLKFKAADRKDPMVEKNIDKGKKEINFDVDFKNQHLWSLEDPYLYEVEAILQDNSEKEDRVTTYFGMRKISVENMPGTSSRYIALNNKPVYLQMTLDQSYHPDGYYTFPSDVFMRDEILRSRKIGLNGQRIHVKIGIPRKLYWADKLGVLIMADVPNSWGQPDASMRQETETALRGMIQRDYNHPSIFSWVIFNETWGLRTRGADENRRRGEYTNETQAWVESVYHMAKKMDPTRLVEDNSANRMDHVITDINSWHAYLPGYSWRERLDQITKDTYAGSGWNFIEGRKQANEPNFNSECGNVWGYEGSTGDLDWSWDYHIMINEFRRHPKVCGWLYTEHHDVINEWNGYYRFDRSLKYTGISKIAEGMGLQDLHGAFYIASERELCTQVKMGETRQVPLYASFMTGAIDSDKLLLRSQLYGWDNLGNRFIYDKQQREIYCAPWMNRELDPLEVTMPDKPALVILCLFLEDLAGNILHRNFTTYYVSEGPAPREEYIRVNDKKMAILRFAPDSYTKTNWSQKQWHVLEGLKVNGAGSGFFEYELQWPQNLKVGDIVDASLRIEVSAKQLFGKDKEGTEEQEGDFMRGRGTHDPSLNPNAYPMTDEITYPSAVRIRVGDQVVGVYDLADDPADHQGILSWYSQKRDRFLREAGSYGYLVTPRIPQTVLKKAAAQGRLQIRFEVDDALPGGLAIYGERFGRYPLDPTLVFVLKE